MGQDDWRLAPESLPGLQRNGLWAYLVAAAYNLIRMVKLMPAPA